jgi:nucleoside-diphosphate-sugar epimerase
VSRDPKFSFVRHDVTEYIAVDGPLDWVLHFASPASPRDYLELPIQTLKVGALGTHNSLGLAKAKGASFLLASTSEVYGDPLVHPQSEEYWGHVNPVGPRGVYDEAKRFAEAMTMAYHRYHGVDTRIVRIFNSLPADEFTILFADDRLRAGAIADVVEELDEDLTGCKVLVPAFDRVTCRMGLHRVSAVIRHPCRTDVYELKLRYGRTVRVTADHSVFRRNEHGEPEAVPVRALRVGDDVAIPAVLPVVETDVRQFSISQHLLTTRPAGDLWDYVVGSPSLKAVVEARREEIHTVLSASGRFNARRQGNALGCASNKYRRSGFVPLAVLKLLNIDVPPDAVIRMLHGPVRIALPDRITITDDILWLIGFFLAEGCAVKKGKNCFLSFCSDQHFLDRAAAILEEEFCVHVVRVPYTPGHGPSIATNSRLVHLVFQEIFGVMTDTVPAWILQLPLSRLKWFLEGYREGDGTHSGKMLDHEMAFSTVSRRRAMDLNLILLRFGIVASIGRYETTFKQRYGDRRFPFWRLTICEVSNFDILEWDKGVAQTLNARRIGDLVWARVRSIQKAIATPDVYDFSVPDAENFFGGNGVACHNTFGPRMRVNDGRAIPAFITQALTRAPLTVFGDGSQTRSFQYIDDLVDGLWRLMQARGVHDPVNIGNPHEMTLLELAQRILRLTGSASPIVFEPLPVDDPKVRQPDIVRARTLLGWSPKVDVERGLSLTIEWFRQKISKGVAR